MHTDVRNYTRQHATLFQESGLFGGEGESRDTVQPCL